MRKWEGWFAWRCINQAMRSEMVSSSGFGEKNALIDTSNKDLYRLILRRKTPPFFFNTSTPSTYVLILFGSRPCIAILCHTFLSSLPKVFKMKWRYTCARLSQSHRTLTRSLRTLTQSLLHAANPTKGTHPHWHVLPHVNKPNSAILPQTHNFCSYSMFIQAHVGEDP